MWTWEGQPVPLERNKSRDECGSEHCWGTPSLNHIGFIPEFVLHHTWPVGAETIVKNIWNLDMHCIRAPKKRKWKCGNVDAIKFRSSTTFSCLCCLDWCIPPRYTIPKRVTVEHYSLHWDNGSNSPASWSKCIESRSGTEIIDRVNCPSLEYNPFSAVYRILKQISISSWLYKSTETWY